MLCTSKMPLCLFLHALQYKTSLFFPIKLNLHVYSVYRTLCYKHPETFTQIHVCCSSVAKLCPTLCDPRDHGTPGLSVPHRLSQFAQVHVQWIDYAAAFVPESVILVSLFLCSFWWQPEQLETGVKWSLFSHKPGGHVQLLTMTLTWGLSATMPKCDLSMWSHLSHDTR